MDQTPSKRIVLPFDIQLLGARSYEFRVDPSGTLTTIQLFDSTAQGIGTLEVLEERQGKSLLVKYSDAEGQTWVRTQTIASKDDVTFTTTSSDGDTMTMSAKIEPNKNTGKQFAKFRISTLTIADEKGGKEFHVGRTIKNAARLTLQHAIASEEGRFFSTPGLMKIRELIQNFSRVQAHTFQAWSGEAESNIWEEQWIEPVFEPVGGGSMCSSTVAICSRMPIVQPLFYCYTGIEGAACDGLYWAGDYLFSTSFKMSCANLNGCV